MGAEKRRLQVEVQHLHLRKTQFQNKKAEENFVLIFTQVSCLNLSFSITTEKTTLCNVLIMVIVMPISFETLIDILFTH